MGYARLEQKIRKDTQADQPLGRHILWKEARVNKEGVVDNENVKKVVELCETIEQSSETQEGNKDTCRDILGKVFNVPEYSGRVRGKGFGVTPKSFFPQEKRQKPSNEEVLEKLRILSEQVALLVNTNKDKQLPVQLQPEIQMESETGSCNVGLKSIPEVLQKSYGISYNVKKFLRSLPSKWRPKITTIQETKDLNKLLMEELVSSLKSHDIELVAHKPKKKSNSLALQATENLEESKLED
ncbi:uncharacterized protein [Cicer arietinum]|uniref:uncharacterized protein n=1 Tax=Cicer arietinum TaxID=3827 RepID=UPI003CC6CBA6